MRLPARWHPLRVKPADLRLEATLQNGQCFGWRRLEGCTQPTWVGVLDEHVLALRETNSDCLFGWLGGRPSAPPPAADAVRANLRDYFQLSQPLGPLYARWAAADPRMAAVAAALPGMRVLRQDPVECLFSFICSSNNNIARIGGMLRALRARYGVPLQLAPNLPPAAVDAATSGGSGGDDGDAAAESYYAFPTAARLAAATEEELRGLGLGYRASYVRGSAQLVESRGAAWLKGLRAEAHDPAAVRDALCTLPGVGPKVADCVALFSLDATAAIPVDIHVWQIACRDLDPTLSQALSLTPAVYARVGDTFRERYGDHAGWAHSVLFAGELPLFRTKLPASVQAEMAAWKEQEKAAKVEAVAKRKAAREAKAEAKDAAEEPKTVSKKRVRGIAAS